MYPFYNNNQGFPLPILPFFSRRRTRIPTLDNRGIYEVCTTGVAEITGLDTEEDNVTFGINANLWRQLPNEFIFLWKVRHPVSETGATLPGYVAIPTSSSSSTINSPSSSISNNTKKVSIVDNRNTQVTGGDITNTGVTTEHLVYVNKCNDTFKLLGVTTAEASAPAA